MVYFQSIIGSYFSATREGCVHHTFIMRIKLNSGTAMKYYINQIQSMIQNYKINLTNRRENTIYFNGIERL
jgi:hypothetical protein